MSDHTQPPAGWRTICLGKHAIIKARLGWKGLKAEEYTEDGYIFLATPNLKGRRIDFENVDHISKWRYDESPEIQLRVGDVLIVKDGSTLGISNYVRQLPRPTTVNGSIAVVRVDETIESEFLYQFVNGDEFQYLIAMKKAGLGVPHLFQADLRKFDISLPPLPEQRKIARILTTLDNLIEKTEALIAKYQAIKQGMMHDLLIRGVDAHGHLRPPQTEAPELYKQSDLGWIPKQWEFSCVANEFNISTGFTLGTHRRPTKNIRPYLRVANVQRDEILLDDVATLEATDEEFDSRKLEEDDLLVVEGHADPNQIGRCARVTAKSAGLTFQNHLFRLRTRSLNPRFACDWLNSYEARHYWLCRCATSSGLNTINQTMLRRMPCVVPLPEEQEQIAARSVAHSSTVEKSVLSLTKLQHIKCGLMQDLLTGKLRVKPDNCEPTSKG